MQYYSERIRNSSLQNSGVGHFPQRQTSAAQGSRWSRISVAQELLQEGTRVGVTCYSNFMNYLFHDFGNKPTEILRMNGGNVENISF